MIPYIIYFPITFRYAIDSGRRWTTWLIHRSSWLGTKPDHNCIVAIFNWEPVSRLGPKTNSFREIMIIMET